MTEDLGDQAQEFLIPMTCPSCKGFGRPPLRPTGCDTCFDTGTIHKTSITGNIVVMIPLEKIKSHLKDLKDWHFNKGKLSEEDFSVWFELRVDELKEKMDNSSRFRN